MRSRLQSLVRAGAAAGVAWATLGCASCTFTTSLDGLSRPPDGDGDGGAAPGSEASPADGNFAASEAASTSEGGAVESGAGEGGAPAPTYRAAVLADAPLAYWRLGESAGTKIAKDETGNGHDGMVGANVVFGGGGALAGETDTAANFDGSATGVITIGDFFRFDGVASFTLEAWARPTGAGNYGVILARNLDPSGYALYIAPSLGVAFERHKTGADDILTGPSASTSSFTHVVATYDGSSMLLYVNGALVQGPLPSTAIPGGATKFFIGADVTGTSDSFNGSIDEPAVYDHALSATQILTHYRIGKGP